MSEVEDKELYQISSVIRYQQWGGGDDYDLVGFFTKNKFSKFFTKLGAEEAKDKMRANAKA